MALETLLVVRRINMGCEHNAEAAPVTAAQIRRVFAATR
jgi:hypothetical protein